MWLHGRLACRPQNPPRHACPHAGATGLVGSRLTQKLVADGARVKVLTRDPNSAKSKVPAGPKVDIVGPADWGSSLKGCTGVVNLAGEPIATRWSPEMKEKLVSSRVGTTQALVVRGEGRVRGSGLATPSVQVKGSAGAGFWGSSFAFIPCMRGGSVVKGEHAHACMRACVQAAIRAMSPGSRPKVLVSASAVGEGAFRDS